VTGQVSGPQSFSPYLAAAANVGSGNQSAAMDAARINEQARQFEQAQAWEKQAFGMNRQDTQAAIAANNAAAQSAGRTSAFGNIAGMLFGGWAGNGFKL
jgi:hypothetical protein